MKCKALFLLIAIPWSQFALALCVYVPEQQLEVTVRSCETIDPRNHSRLDPTHGRARINDSYKGVLISTYGAKYFMSDSTLSACDTLNEGERLAVRVGTACCDGADDVPCALGTSKFIIESDSL